MCVCDIQDIFLLKECFMYVNTNISINTAQDLMLLWYVDDIFSYTRYGFSSQLELYMYQ